MILSQMILISNFIAGDVSVTNQTTKLFCERNENFYYIMKWVIKTLITF